jgi:hypothetical protein
MPGKLVVVIEGSNMIRFQRLILWVVSLSFFLLTTQSCSFFPGKGAATREELVSTYLLALEKKDEQLMLNLIPSDYDAEQVVEEKINRLGNRKLEQLKVSYQDLQKPDSSKVTIEGIYYDKPLPNGKQFRSTDEIFVHASGKRWYLILGHQRESRKKV